MSILIAIVSLVLLGFVGPALFGVWYFTPVFCVPISLILWNGNTRRAIIWGAIISLIGEMIYGLVIGTVTLIFLIFIIFFSVAKRFISWKPLVEHEGRSIVHILTSFIIVIFWYVFVFAIWMLWNILVGGEISSIVTYITQWLNLRVIGWAIGVQVLLIILYGLLERQTAQYGKNLPII